MVTGGNVTTMHLQHGYSVTRTTRQIYVGHVWTRSLIGSLETNSGDSLPRKYRRKIGFSCYLSVGSALITKLTLL